MFAPLKGERYDLIISNPPYVDADGMAGLPRECEYEPKMAFDGGADGIDLVRRILGEAKRISPKAAVCCAKSAAAVPHSRPPIHARRSSGSTRKNRKARCFG